MLSWGRGARQDISAPLRFGGLRGSVEQRRIFALGITFAIRSAVLGASVFRTVAALLLLAPTPALACAGFFHDPLYEAESSAQKAIFRPLEGMVQVDYAVDLRVDTPEFGWVIPIPGPFVSFEDGDPADFSTLLAQTGPTYDIAEERSGCAMANDMALGGVKGGGDTAGGVDEIYQGETPTYSYSVLEATSADALSTWLEEHGWYLGDTGASIQEYVSEGGYQFVAIALKMDVVEGSAVQAELPPVRLKYEGDKLVYPSRMGRYSPEVELSTLIWVIGDQRASIRGGWDQVELPLVWEGGETSSYLTEVAAAKIREIGSEGGFALTWAGEYGDGWATRFETVAPTGIHTVDVEFSVDGGTDAPLALTLSNQQGCKAPAGAQALLLFPLVALLRRRKLV